MHPWDEVLDQAETYLDENLGQEAPGNAEVLVVLVLVPFVVAFLLERTAGPLVVVVGTCLDPGGILQTADQALFDPLETWEPASADVQGMAVVRNEELMSGPLEQSDHGDQQTDDFDLLVSLTAV